MKLLWTILIHLAIFVVLLAITIFILVFSIDWSPCDDYLTAPTLEGYRNHQLVQFSPANELDVKKIVELQNKLNLIPWSNALREGWPFMVQVPPDQAKDFAFGTETLHLPFILLSTNLQKYLTNRKHVVTESKLEKSTDFDLNRYHYFAEIENYLLKLSEEHKTRMNLNTYGSSIENRQLYYVRVFNPTEEATAGDDKQSKEKKIVLFECGAHAREWLSPSVCLHFINNLLYDADSQPLLEEYEFYILPSINPDGYVYSWTKDRMWRKNRRRFANNCYGVDLNRNFNIGFNTSAIPESINVMKSVEESEKQDQLNKTRFERFVEQDPDESIQCSNLYPGERPFSENETFYLKRLIDRLTTKPNVYFSMHAYSQMWLYPFGTSQVSVDDEKLKHYAKIGVQHLQRSRENGSDWKLGRSNEVMYNAGGTSMDWAHKDAGIDLVYSLEMRDSGLYGFLLPEDQIEIAAKESWAGIKAILQVYAEDLNNNVTIATTSE